MMSSAQLSEARIQAAVELAEHQRPHAERVAHAEQRFVGQHQQRVGALDLAQGVDQAVDDASNSCERAIRWMMTSVSVVDWKMAAHPHQLLAQQVGVGEVAVVGEGQAAEVEIGEDRLDVAVGRAAGRGVAVMADRANSPCSLAMTDGSPKMSPTRPAAR